MIKKSKRWMRFRYIILSNLWFQISGQAAYSKILDIIHYLRGREPIWKDAETCHRLFCRYCGGKLRK